MRRIFAVALILLCFGCYKGTTHDKTTGDNRFVTVSFQEEGGDWTEAIMDRKTGNQYLLVKRGYGCAIVKLDMENHR